MEPNRPKALLIGESPQGSQYLTKRLQENGCECAFAVTCREACSLLRAQDFDLVLSPMRLSDGSLYPLIGLLDGSGITLFYYHPVEDGCLWLPALRRGQKCFGSSALRPSEFVAALDETTREIRAMQRKTEQCVAHELSRSVARRVSSRGELPPSVHNRGQGQELLECNAVV
jgi:CheY-like chemotaxis protein